MANTPALIDQPRPIDAGFDRLGQLGDHPAEVASGRQGAKHRQGRVDARCLAVPRPRAGTHVHEVEKEAVLVRHVAPEGAQHALSAGAALGPRFPTALGANHQGGQAETHRGDTGHLPGEGTVGLGPVGNQAGVRMRRVEKIPKSPPLHVLEEKVIGHGPK